MKARSMSLIIKTVGPDEKDFFGKIWIPWLESSMGVQAEAEDLEAMRDPMSFYGQTGGTAFLAMLAGEVVGTVAVKGLGSAGFEFCKLVVLDAARGQGAGRRLVDACSDYAREQGGPALWLQSFTRLKVALGMYERMGFVHAPPPPEMDVLDRTEVIMWKKS